MNYYSTRIIWFILTTYMFINQSQGIWIKLNYGYEKPGTFTYLAGVDLTTSPTKEDPSPLDSLQQPIFQPFESFKRIRVMGWPFGRRRDYTVKNNCNQVLYFTTTEKLPLTVSVEPKKMVHIPTNFPEAVLVTNYEIEVSQALNIMARYGLNIVNTRKDLENLRKKQKSYSADELLRIYTDIFKRFERQS